ncbi:MAG TPA: methyltransferase domain-containing protein [Rhizomicrobium sp.]|nr:methyltransferase domain-containing protein [Rhizomicrobium sp.]
MQATMTDAELAVVRRAFARQVLAAVGVENARLEHAFAAVKREAFCGPGPWQIYRFGQVYRPTPSADPVYLYTDDLVGLVPERTLNNGQPSLHAHLINQANPRMGEHAVHVGTGGGYFTAVLAEMVGADGRVTGIEFDEGLARRSRDNLRERANVRIVHGDGASVPFDPADIIYVNAGATHPAAHWLDRLNDGGRLILPLTTNKAFGRVGTPPQQMIGQGAVLRITRQASEFHVKWISAVAIFPCEGVRDETCERLLAESLAKGGLQTVTRLCRRPARPDENAWLSAPEWCLVQEPQGPRPADCG